MTDAFPAWQVTGFIQANLLLQVFILPFWCTFVFCRPSCSSVAGFSHGHVVSNENLFQHDQFFFFLNNFWFDFFQNFPSWIFHFILWLVAQTRHYSFLSLFYLSIICSSCPTYLFSLSVGGGTRRTHSQKFNLKKKMHKKKIPNRNWKITLRMWMRGGRKVKRKSLIFPPPNYSFCTQSPATLFPTIRSTRFCFVWFF